MRTLLSFLMLFFSAALAFAQQPADTWSNVTKASDDRYTNPKSAVYAGPNGWWNFGEVRAEGSSDATLKFAYKGGFNELSGTFVLVDQEKLQTFYMNFGTGEPAPGVYTIDKKADPAQKKVIVSFSDVANKKIKEWSGASGSGTVTVTKSGNFLYFKARKVSLQPTGLHQEGNFKQPIILGIEGAVKP
ncbi:MAG: hypothetical protein ABIN80_05530 [Dyadobacter sp.]|uniref:hypothetical protein n=1 Tax=Dyadobacter sp. TaxID=1914288 RepID=UPI0032666966